MTNYEKMAVLYDDAAETHRAAAEAAYATDRKGALRQLGYARENARVAVRLRAIPGIPVPPGGAVGVTGRPRASNEGVSCD